MFLLITLLSIVLRVSCSSNELKTENTFFNSVFKNYKKIPPGQDLGYGTTKVQTGIYINSFDSISEQQMDFEISIYLRLNWTDERLDYEKEPLLRNRSVVKMEDKLHASLWMPDIYFRNEKAAKFHFVTVPNRMLNLHKTGIVWSVSKITATLSCPMNLEKYPLDTQICPMYIESFGYHPSTVQLQFLERAVQYKDDLQLSQFKLHKHSLSTSCTGIHSCLKIEFILQRETGFYMVEVYVPTILIVIMSWITFWIHADAIPARTSIGLLTVLTMTTKSSAAGASLPKVSYIKAIDVWMSTCLVFVFASLLEFAIVHILARRYAQEQQLQQHQQLLQSSPGRSPANSPTSVKPPALQALERSASAKSNLSNKEIEMRLLSAAEERTTDVKEEYPGTSSPASTGNLRFRPLASGSQQPEPARRSSFTPMMPLEDFALTPGAAEQVPMIDSHPPEVTQLTNVPVATPCPHDPGAPYHLCQRCLTCRRQAPAFQAVDQFSRAFFPILFILFNIGYWVFYLVVLP